MVIRRRFPLGPRAGQQSKAKLQDLAQINFTTFHSHRVQPGNEYAAAALRGVGSCWLNSVSEQQKCGSPRPPPRGVSDLIRLRVVMIKMLERGPFMNVELFIICLLTLSTVSRAPTQHSEPLSFHSDPL